MNTYTATPDFYNDYIAHKEHKYIERYKDKNGKWQYRYKSNNQKKAYKDRKNQIKEARELANRKKNILDIYGPYSKEYDAFKRSTGIDKDHQTVDTKKYEKSKSYYTRKSQIKQARENAKNKRR